MIAYAKAQFLLVSPRKIRRVTRLLKGLEADRAQALLANLPKGAAGPVAKVLKSALNNATRDGSWTVDRLVISKVLADEGPSLKRFRAGAMGRAMPIRKRMTHLRIELDAKPGGAISRGA